METLRESEREIWQIDDDVEMPERALAYLVANGVDHAEAAATIAREFGLNSG